MTYMGRYVLVRTLWIFVVIVIILSLNFILLKFAPEYPPTEREARRVYFARQVKDGYMTVRLEYDLETILSLDDNTYERCEDCEYQKELTFYRIYEPVPVSLQYVRWVRNIMVDWNWGLSTRVQQSVPVFTVLSTRMPVTLKLNFVALFFYIPIGFTLGIIAALKKNTLIDNSISLGVMVFISIPSFVTMTILVLIFGYQLEWLPTQYPAADLKGMIQFTGLILPVFGLSIGAIAGLTRITRAELTEVLTSEFLLLARTKGLTKRQAVLRHAMRNSMVPLVPVVIGSFVGLLSGSIIIELIYGIPGTGRIYLQAMDQGNYDFNLILGITAFYTIIGLFAVLLVDLSYGIVDPRIRMGARK